MQRIIHLSELNDIFSQEELQEWGKNMKMEPKEYDINQIVIGYPIGLNNSENRMTDLVNLFIQEISIFNIPIHKIDERLSSKLFNDGSKERIDDLSALEILESYIKQND